MSNRILFAVLCAGLVFAARHPAQAEVFTWNPQVAGLDGGSVTADTLRLSDYAQVTFGDAGTSFTDTGFLPVIGFSLGSQAIAPAGFGTSWGAYIQYSGTGQQMLTPRGFPASATFGALSYAIVGYNGTAAFGFTPSGAAEVTGALSDVTTLEQGSLTSGSLAFVPGAAGFSILGTLLAAIDSSTAGFAPSDLADLSVMFVHPPGEYSFQPDGTLRVAGGSSSTATLVPAVPEPASILLLGAGAAGLVVLRRRA